MQDYFSVFLKGLAMGACDVVPGVSGGTVAFVTGIYERLVHSITCFTPKLLLELKEKGISAVWKKVDGNFLLSLLLGIGISLFTFSNIITTLLETHPPIIWSLFFSLVLTSSFTMLSNVKSWNITRLVFLIVGIICGYYITILTPGGGSPSYSFIFISGFIAICAMILPGISGSFVLLLMGQYVFVFNAIANLNIPVILVFGLGCAIGLHCFSHVVKWLFAHYEESLLCFLIGLMFGSLNKIWPWKKTVTFITNGHGEAVPALQENLLPSRYASELALDPMLQASVIVMILAFVGVILFDRLGKKNA